MGISARRSRQEWEDILAAHQSSGLSLKAFGEREQINYHTLIYWRQIFRKKSKEESAGSFIKITPTSSGETRSFVELHYGKDISLNLPLDYDVSDLVILLKGLSC